MTDFACKDCTYSRISKVVIACSYIFEFKEPDAYWYRCARDFVPTTEEEIDPVTGRRDRIKAEMKYCTDQRTYGKCGPRARFWQPKNKKDLFKYLSKDDF